MKTLFIATFFLYAGNICAQSLCDDVSIVWDNSLRIPADESGNSMDLTTDGGFIIAGQAGYPDNFTVTELNSDGEVEWAKVFGGSNSDVAKSVKQTSDGGYIVAGYASSDDGDVPFHYGVAGDKDAWVIKLSSTGVMEWQKILGGTAGDYATSVIQTIDGGYALAGYTSSVDGDILESLGNDDYWVVKLSAAGDIEWQNNSGGLRNDIAYSIIQTTNGNYYVAGHTTSDDGDVTNHNGTLANNDIWIAVLDDAGDLINDKALGTHAKELCYSIQPTSDNGFIVCRFNLINDPSVTNNHGVEDYWIIKLGATLNVEWQKSYGGSGNDYGYYAEETTDGNYILGGYSNSEDYDVSNNYLALITGCLW